MFGFKPSLEPAKQFLQNKRDSNVQLQVNYLRAKQIRDMKMEVLSGALKKKATQYGVSSRSQTIRDQDDQNRILNGWNEDNEEFRLAMAQYNNEQEGLTVLRRAMGNRIEAQYRTDLKNAELAKDVGDLGVMAIRAYDLSNTGMSLDKRADLAGIDLEGTYPELDFDVGDPFGGLDLDNLMPVTSFGTAPTTFGLGSSSQSSFKPVFSFT